MCVQQEGNARSQMRGKGVGPRRPTMTPIIPQGLTGRVCPKSLGSCGQPSSSSEAVVRLSLSGFLRLALQVGDA